MEQLQEFFAPIIALLIAGLWAEVRNRITMARTATKIVSTDSERKQYQQWCDAVKQHTYREFNLIKAGLYDSVNKNISGRIEDGQKIDMYKDRHGVKVPMPLLKREEQLREDQDILCGR